MSALSTLFLASCLVWMSGAQTAFKRVAEENVTLPCHHRLGLLEPRSLDIEWLLHDSKANQKVVITYSGGNVYNEVNEGQKGRVSFTSNFLAGDASLQIVSLQPSDAGQYTCKVKNAGQYEWHHITLTVLEKPSKPKCWVEGELSEGKELSLQCNSASGTAPILYQWQRISDEEGKMEHLPPTARVNFSNPGQVLMKNLTQMATGLYQCTAYNEAGQENCFVQVTVQYARSIGMVAGAVCGVLVGLSLVFLIVWLTIRRKEKKRYEEEEAPNEIREDAEAPKARLVKPSSSSSGSRSSRSGSSSTRSTANSASRSQRTLSTEATPHITPSRYSRVETEGREIDPKKVNHATLVKMGATPVMLPAQSRAFQTV
ncbi:CXADR-like membrane protein isoform X1 [Pelodiscus sinensis]|uniref:CXADR like membrane protein n=2 Tax=Pelodiscus sinensis TaxID=13735 RepID=K7G0B6_PELSI|nr:CXADR-like membrane protein [Pelodiscus sinensis]|eukprot:XP_006116688.1 CXADR-like membrane protein [Pelodiscus sinensis]